MREQRGGGVAQQHIIYGGNASVLLFDLSLKYRHVLQKYDEIVISTSNHNANINPWIELVTTTCKDLCLKVVWWDQGVSTSAPPVTASTKLVLLTHCSNVFGSLYDIKAQSSVIKELSGGRAHVIVDGVAAAPHRFVDFSSLPCVDFYAVSCHKLFGPHIGVMVGRKPAMREVEKANCWGSATAGTASSAADADTCDSRFWERGTVNFEACAGIVGLLEYFISLGEMDESKPPGAAGGGEGGGGGGGGVADAGGIASGVASLSLSAHNEEGGLSLPCFPHLTRLDLSKLNRSLIESAYYHIELAEAAPLTYLLGKVRLWKNVILVSEGDDQHLFSNRRRLPIVSIVHRTVNSEAIATELLSQGMIVRSGFFLSDTCLQAWATRFKGWGGEGGQYDHFKAHGAVRISMAHYNTIDEVERVCRCLEAIDGW